VTVRAFYTQIQSLTLAEIVNGIKNNENGEEKETKEL
jgi:hypothetical protein